MEIKSLENTPLSEITACFNLAFSDYFVQIPATEAYLKKRWQASRVDYSLSFGAFENHKLVAFIIHGIDMLNGQKTAYNSGTGVIPDFRGQKLVQQLYAFAIPKLKAAGVTQSTLEVITQNHKAIKAYERVGFKTVRTLHCFKGSFQAENLLKQDEFNFTLKRQPAPATLRQPLQPFEPSWENQEPAIKQLENELETLQVFYQDQPKGYAILHPANGAIMQLGLANENSSGVAEFLFKAIAETQPTVRINNVDSRATSLVENLKKAGLENHIDQYEMLLTF